MTGHLDPTDAFRAAKKCRKRAQAAQYVTGALCIFGTFVYTLVHCSQKWVIYTALAVNCALSFALYLLETRESVLFDAVASARMAKMKADQEKHDANGNGISNDR